MSEHEKIICSECYVIIRQCRCIREVKKTRFELCDKCKNRWTINKKIDKNLEKLGVVKK